MATKRSCSYDNDKDGPSPEKKQNTGKEFTETRKCYSCAKTITDTYCFKLSNSLDWHFECLKCIDCDRLLTEKDTCFLRCGKIYCKEDYLRNFSTSCYRCKRTFSISDMVIRSKFHLYHVGCFKCDICQNDIRYGQEFTAFRGKIYCAKDFVLTLNKYDETKIEKVHPEQTEHDAYSSTGQCEEDSDDKDECPQSENRKEKTTRVRTVLNEKQLYTLRTCYHANPRPDALMKEQLVEMTGLSPRVIRVWFQNKRCKDKKKTIFLKQMHEQQKLRALSRSAIPMTASAPMSNDSMMSSQHQMNIMPMNNPWLPEYSSVPSTLNNQRHKYDDYFNIPSSSDIFEPYDDISQL